MWVAVCNFNPRFPRGKRPARFLQLGRISHFNPRFPRGKRRCGTRIWFYTRKISIHASRGGSDLPCPTLLYKIPYFNPRFPRGKRPTAFPAFLADVVFQSTLPAGEATNGEEMQIPTITISIHASREGSDKTTSNTSINPEFQSTLPAREATLPDVYSPTTDEFQSTLPAREATKKVQLHTPSRSISIHASREGSDSHSAQSMWLGLANFNPRFPRGKRRCTPASADERWEFQSTLPAREATVARMASKAYTCISIHASREGSDLLSPCCRPPIISFQSTLPAREATCSVRWNHRPVLFQSTLPAGEATDDAGQKVWSE